MIDVNDFKFSMKLILDDVRYCLFLSETNIASKFKEAK